MRLSGIVERHRGRGRELGFPTANLAIPDTATDIVPGIYAAYVWVGEQRYRAAVFIEAQIEAHLLDFSADLYSKIITIELHNYLRPSRRFDNVEQLRQAINSDINNVKQCLPA